MAFIKGHEAHQLGVLKQDPINSIRSSFPVFSSKHLNMKTPSLTVLTALTASLFSGQTQAASCAKYDSAMASFIRNYESQLWSLRQNMCGNNACGNTQTCTLRAYSSFAGVSLYRKDVQYNFPNCWVSPNFRMVSIAVFLNMSSEGYTTRIHGRLH